MALRKAATRRPRSSARVARTTWLGSTPSKGTVVRSGRRALPECRLRWPRRGRAPGVADGDAVGLCGGTGGGRGLGGGSQQRLGPRQEDLPGLGQPGALRSAVEQARAELLLEAANLTAQGRLGDVECLGGAAEMPVLGDGRELPHQPQIEVRYGS